LSRALELTPSSECGERYELLLARESIYRLLGKRDVQRQDLAELEALAQELGVEQQAEVGVRRARYASANDDFAEAMAIAQAAVQSAQAAGQPGVQALAHMRWGHALYHQGDVSTAREQYEQALALARSGGLRVLEAEALYNLSEYSSDLANRRSHGEQAVRIARETRDRIAECNALNTLSAIRLESGDLAASWTSLEQALNLAREIGDRSCEGWVLLNLSIAWFIAADYVRARNHCDQALRIGGEIDDGYLTVVALGQRALVARSLGDVAGAWRDARQALRLARKAGIPEPLGWTEQALGHLYREEDPATSHACHAQALRLFRQFGLEFTTEPLAGLACAELAQGELAQALAHVAEILAYLDGGGCLRGERNPFWTYLTCYQVLAAAGDPRTAEILDRAHAQLQEWAARIPDEATRRSFLENVPWNREIVRLWQLAHPRDKCEEKGQVRS